MYSSIQTDLVTRRVLINDYEVKDYEGIVRAVFHDGKYLKAIVEKEGGELEQCNVVEMKIIRK